MTEPTDAELDELRQANSGRLNFVTLSEFRTIARAVLAKWGTPQPVVREPLTDSQAQAGACEWKHDDDDDFWDTECGQPWRFDDGGPKENHMNFCPCCGKPLRIKGGQHGTE